MAWAQALLLIFMATSAKPFARRKVLLVDDNEDQVRTLGFLLSEMGHETRFALTGESALHVARRFLPDVVLLDLGLPDIDGATLCRRLRSESLLEGVVIVMMTGSGRSEDRERMMEAGCNHFLIKPVDPKFLESLLGSMQPSRK